MADERPLNPEPLDEELDALLRAARPEPSMAFQAQLQRELLPDAAPAARRGWGLPRIRPAVAWATLGLGIATAGLALTGDSPFTRGGDDARATTGCTTVYVTKVAPVGELRKGADGQVRVETVERPVVKAEQRCK